jgi:methionine synthase I (cobalamin-dependent)
VLAAAATLRSGFSLPIIVSLQCWPEAMADAVRRLEDLGVDSVGENCQGGLEAAIRTAEGLGKFTRLPLWIKPSAGLPGAAQESPESFGKAARRLVAAGVRFLGGCCGTTEAHVVALREACYDL